MEKKIGFFLFLVTAIFFTYQYFTGKKEREKLLNDHTVTVAIINDFVSTKYGYIFRYTYSTGEEMLHGSMIVRIRPKRSLIGKRVPVMYSNTNPENNYLLMIPDGFKHNNLVYPDSLNWVYDHTYHP